MGALLQAPHPGHLGDPPPILDPARSSPGPQEAVPALTNIPGHVPAAWQLYPLSPEIGPNQARLNQHQAIASGECYTV